MRTPFLSPPPEEELRSWPIRELVRDFPELLPLLRASVPDLDSAGGRTLLELFGEGEGAGPVLNKVLEWRRSARPGSAPIEEGKQTEEKSP